MKLEELSKVFDPSDIEWRVQTGGKKNGQIWALVLAYVTNRAIMDRLDEVCGPENWRNEYQVGPGGGVLCGLSIRIDGEWITKWDGAENTDIESVKGGLSGAMKRAGVQWGIGRYLYNLPAIYVYADLNGTERGQLPQKQGGDYFKWNVPELPAWALPAGYKSKKEKKADPQEPKKSIKQIEPNAVALELRREFIELIDKNKQLLSEDEIKKCREQIQKSDTLSGEYRCQRLSDNIAEWAGVIIKRQVSPSQENHLDIFLGGYYGDKTADFSSQRKDAWSVSN